MPKTQDEKIAEMTFAMIYPSYVKKVEKKGRSEKELQKVIKWLTNYDESKQKEMIEKKATFKEFFENADLNENVSLITGSVCGVKIEEVENSLTKNVRYLDKLVDELAKGKSLESICREK